MSDFSFKGSGGLVADSDSKKKSQKEWHMLAYVIFYLYLCSRFGKRAHRWDGLNGKTTKNETKDSYYSGRR